MIEPKLAASNIAWEPADDDAAAKILHARGFRGIEVAPTKLWAAPTGSTTRERRDVRERWRDRGFEIVALQSLLYGHPELTLFGSDAARRTLLDYLDLHFDIAADLGARTLVFGSPANRRRGEMPLYEATLIATEFFREAGALAARRGVVLAVEPNPPEYGCDFLTTVRDTVEFVRDVESPGVVMHGDLAAATYAGDTVDLMLTGDARITHFHVSEPDLIEVGRGRADHNAAAAALTEGGYGGWISIEMRKATEPLEALTRAADFVRRVYGNARP